MRLLIVLLSVLCLTACGTVGVTAPATMDTASVDTQKATDQLRGFLDGLKQFADADLAAASVDAKAHNDVEAAQCWDGLRPILAALKGSGAVPGLPTGMGAAQLFQAVRDVLQGGSRGTSMILKQINMACGPLYVSARGDVLKLIVALGAMASGAPGAGGFLNAAGGALPSLLQTLPIPIR